MHHILRARAERYGLRKFTVPGLNFAAADYFCLRDWQSIEIIESPLLDDNSEVDIEMLVARRDTLVVNFPKYLLYATHKLWRGV